MPLSDKIYKVVVQVAIINFALSAVIGGRLAIIWFMEREAERQAQIAEDRLNAILNNNSIKILDAYGKGTKGQEIEYWEDEGIWYGMSGCPYCSFKVNATIKNYLDFSVNNLELRSRRAGARAFNLTANQELTLSMGADTYGGEAVGEKVILTLYYNGTKIDQLIANVTWTRG